MRSQTNRLLHTGQVLLPGLELMVMERPYRARTRLAALRYALRGIAEAWQTQPNLRLHASAAFLAIGLGWWCRLALTEWLWVTFAIGLVIFTELMNTAIEETVDLVIGLRPDPLAKRVKDIAAGCVLVAAILAVAIGAFTFTPHLLNR